jgi:gamma-glutamyltranspeptidase
MSSMAPIIVLDENDDFKLVLGGSGGLKIISGVSQV